MKEDRFIVCVNALPSPSFSSYNTILYWCCCDNNRELKIINWVRMTFVSFVLILLLLLLLSIQLPGLLLLNTNNNNNNNNSNTIMWYRLASFIVWLEHPLFNVMFQIYISRSGTMAQTDSHKHPHWLPMWESLFIFVGFCELFCIPENN